MARSFSAALNDAFNIDSSIDNLSQTVEQKYEFMKLYLLESELTSAQKDGCIYADQGAGSIRSAIEKD